MRKNRKTGNYTVSIGVAGAERQVGVTHLSIMIANYLASKERCRAAVADMSEGDSLTVLKDIYGGSTESGGTAGFQMHKVDYYNQIRQKDIANIFQMGYEYVVIDFGKVCLNDDHSEILRCHMRILTGSCCEWQQKAFIEAIEEQRRLNDAGSWKYASFLGIEAVRRSLEKRYRLHIHKIPFEEDPFLLHRHHFEPLRTMLQED